MITALATRKPRLAEKSLQLWRLSLDTNVQHRDFPGPEVLWRDNEGEGDGLASLWEADLEIAPRLRWDRQCLAVRQVPVGGQ